MFQRYAIFYTPAPGPFAALGAAWLGWDNAMGAPAAHPPAGTLDLARLTATPRKYGFHATLKAPFRLAPDATAAALQDAVVTFARAHAPVALGSLAVTTAHGFVALRPTAHSDALRPLAAAIVTDLDRFRAPLTAEDIARRRKARLSPRQDQQMLDWGYPFIFDDFNFHMTLTGSLKGQDAAQILPQVRAVFDPVLPPAPQLDALTLMGEDADGMFHQIHRAALSG